MKVTNEQLIKINNKKIDMDKLYSKYEKYIDCFRYKMWLKEDVEFNKDTYKKILADDSNEYIDDRKYMLISLSWDYLESNLTSLFSPAYNFNNFMQSYINYLENTDEHFHVTDISFIEYFCSIHNCLISIKSGLDRIGQLFSYYYKGVAKYATFGHIDKKGKYTSFLAFVNQKINANKEDAIIFQYIMDNYNQWIKDCVSPRDQVIHYNDLTYCESYNEEFELSEPIAISNNMIKFSVINQYINNFYKFVDKIFEYLLFDCQLVPSCDFNGVYLSSNDVMKYITDHNYNPYEDKSLKPVVNFK